MNEGLRRSLLTSLVALVAIGAVVGGYVYREGARTPQAVCEALSRARVVHLLAAGGDAPSCDGVSVHALDAASRARALDAADPAALVSLLSEKKGSAVAVTPGRGGRGVGGELARLAHVPGLRGIVIDPQVAVYAAAREPELADKEREALAYVARALFRGAREPSLSSFPSSLRRVERVEVMVSLAEHGEARLWRSARGTSIARALLTATRVARDRWREREAAMGGPLRERLSSLDVEVSLLSEDGTITQPSAAFLDRAVTPAHGVGFDYRNAWHYSLPSDVARTGKGSAYRALGVLLREQGLTSAVFQEAGTRVYRFVVLALGASPAAPAAPSAADGSSD